MSTINKKPFIKTLLQDMSSSEIATLQTLCDGNGDQTALLRTLNSNPVGSRSHITASDKGVHLCDLEIGFSLFKGYLIYTENYCILLQFTDFQRIQMFDINITTLVDYALIDEYLDINELRSELDDTADAESAEIISVVNEGIQDGTIKVVSLDNTTSIRNLSDEFINNLKSGDIVTKEDETGKHAYVVSYKKDETGICLTYTDASLIETVSYDYSGGHWVYNSTDMTEVASKDYVDTAILGAINDTY